MLIEELADVQELSRAWDSLNKYNTESHGLSNETIADFKSNIETRIAIISEQLAKNSYRFRETRAFLIPKDNGDFRPLQIPEVSDRLVLKNLALILERELADVLKSGQSVSFAYQKGLGVQNAIFQMQEYYKAGYYYILEADIKQFFPTVNREVLLDKIFARLADSSLNEYIAAGISQQVGGLDLVEYPGYFDDADRGIPQGNPLSPLFSNFYLAPFDEQMKQAGYALIRYADDFIVMCKSRAEAEAAYELSKEILENQLLLQLHPLGVDGKTKIVDPVKERFSFLSIGFNGDQIYPSKKCLDRFIKNISTICHEKGRRHNLLTILQRLNNSLDGWISTFSFTNVERYFEEIDTEINKQLYHCTYSLHWELTRKSIGKVKAKFRKPNNGILDSGVCLSRQQRKATGIPFCTDILTLRRPEKAFINIQTYDLPQNR